MIISVKRWRPLALPRLAWRRLKALPTVRAKRERGPGYLESFEKMTEHYVNLVIRASQE